MSDVWGRLSAVEHSAQSALEQADYAYQQAQAYKAQAERYERTLREIGRLAISMLPEPDSERARVLFLSWDEPLTAGDWVRAAFAHLKSVVQNPPAGTDESAVGEPAPACASGDTDSLPSPSGIVPRLSGSFSTGAGI